MRHPRPRLSEYSRWHLAVLVVDQGWPQVRVAELLRVSRPTVAKWVARYRDQGVAGLRDRSSRPESCPHRTPALVEAQVVAERHRLRLGPDDLAARLGLAPVTVWRVLHRHGCSRLADYDRTHTVAVRYQRERAGDWSTSMSRSWVGFLREAAGGSLAGQAKASTRMCFPSGVEITFTLRSTTPPASPSSRSPGMKRLPAAPPSSSTLMPSSPARASRSNEC